MIVNGVHHERDAQTVTSLLAALEIPTRGVAVAVNGEVIPRSTWDTHPVAPTDSVEIVTAAAGGS